MTNGSKIDIYSNGIAIVFLCELSPQRYQREIQWYLDLLHKRQKQHGGWGYDGNSDEGYDLRTGDTSQTQYATLGYWSAYRHGFRIEPDSLERVTQWLMRTQDPTGCWGYQGILAQSSQRVMQSQTSCLDVRRGAGQHADLRRLARCGAGRAGGRLGLETPRTCCWRTCRRHCVRPGRKPTRTDRRPSRFAPGKINLADILETIDLARGWMDKNYAIEFGKYTYYYLYATERYQSFYELLEGISEEEPKWYSDGYELSASRNSGKTGVGRADAAGASTPRLPFCSCCARRRRAFTPRSAKVRSSVDAGMPTNVARARLRGNQIVVEQVQTKVEEMLSMIDDSDQSRLDELARDPTNLIVDKVDETSARRLQQLVRGGEPEVRLLAVRALGRTGNLDYVPTLIFALTDPDREVVLEARDALEFVSRRFDGFGPPDGFTDKQRFDAVDAWKNWYRSLRPGALPEQ